MKKDVFVFALSPGAYYDLMNKKFGSLFKLTDTKYPVFLARAWTDHKNIYILEGASKEEKLLYHEAGHCVGLKHTKDRKNIMFPWFFRGKEGIDEIKEKINLIWVFDYEE